MTKNKECTRYYSSIQEHRVAKLLGGKVVSNSGATAFNKGDVVIDDLVLIECKTLTTEKESFSIKKDWIVKNKQEAFSSNKRYNILTFSFGDGEDYFVIDQELAQKLINYLKEME